MDNPPINIVPHWSHSGVTAPAHGGVSPFWNINGRKGSMLPLIQYHAISIFNNSTESNVLTHCHTGSHARYTDQFGWPSLCLLFDCGS